MKTTTKIYENNEFLLDSLELAFAEMDLTVDQALDLGNLVRGLKLNHSALSGRSVTIDGFPLTVHGDRLK